MGEAATLLARYRRELFDELHRRTADWGFAHLHDPEPGEWFGYLDRRGRTKGARSRNDRS